MNWLVAHIYVVLVVLVGFSLVAGGVVVSERVTPEGSTTANWGRAGGFAFLNTPAQEVSLNQPTLDQLNTYESPEYSTIQFLPPPGTIPQNTLPDEWESLLQQLVAPSDTPTQSGEPSEVDAYSFIPRGLISVAEPVEQKTPAQIELFEYGNRVGSLVRGFEERHTNMISVLKDAYADRTNPTKQAAAENIGIEYQQLGKELEALSLVPSSVASTHKALARSYQEAGQKLVAKMRAPSDEEFLTAIHAYNAAALEFTNRFVALATYLSAAGVTFSTSDPGSIFTFSPM